MISFGMNFVIGTIEICKIRLSSPNYKLSKKKGLSLGL